MGRRYSEEENLKIEYLKLKIKELRYLNYECARLTKAIEVIDTKLSSNSSRAIGIKRNKNQTNSNIEKQWNKLLDEKMHLERKLNHIERESVIPNDILNNLSPVVKDIAIDLFLNKYSLSKLQDKYYTSNPYQTLNDELKYLDIDNF